jgi:hypothetical protein
MINNVFSLREASGHSDVEAHTRTHEEDLWAEGIICRCLSRFVLQPLTPLESSIAYHVELDETGMRLVIITFFFFVDTSYHVLIASDHEYGKPPTVLSLSRF